MQRLDHLTNSQSGLPFVTNSIQSLPIFDALKIDSIDSTCYHHNFNNGIKFMKKSTTNISEQPLSNDQEMPRLPHALIHISQHLDNMTQYELERLFSNTPAPSLSAIVQGIVETTHHDSNRYDPIAYATTSDPRNMLVDDDNPTTIILDAEGTHRGILDSHGLFQETSARSPSVENRSTALGMNID